MDVKKLVLLVLVVFVGFWMFTDPRGLADVASDGGAGLWDMATQLFEATIRFIDELF